MKKQPIYKRWIVDRKGKRARGSKESMRQSLEAHSNAMLDYLAKPRPPKRTDKAFDLSDTYNDIHAAVHAKMAAHWALALQGK